MLRIFMMMFVVSSLSILNAGWNPFEDSNKGEARKELRYDAKQTIKKFKKTNMKLQYFFDKAYGYAVFPNVGKGGIGIGGAYGTGVVYKKHSIIGYSSLTQLTIGFQLGGQAYSEVIFFKDKKALDRFTKGSFELDAQASAVVIKKGASVDIDYSHGVAIFTMPKGGLMYEATVGGQKFSFEK